MRRLSDLLKEYFRGAEKPPATAIIRARAAVIRSPKDVDALYLLFLGRRPESHVVREENVGRPVLEVIEGMLGSDEFATQILDRSLRQQRLPHQSLLLEIPPVLEFIATAGLAPSDKVSATSDWQHILRAVLTEDPCRSLAEARYGELVGAFLDLLAAPDPTIASGVELIGNTLYRGWIIDKTNPSALLHVGVKLNGLTVKVFAANEFRRDVQARYGGEGRVGFTIRLDLLPGADHQDRAIVEIFELSRGIAVLPERHVELKPRAALAFQAEIRHELHELRKAVERLEQSLPELENHQTWPLALYSAAQSLDYLPRPAAPAAERVNFSVVIIDAFGQPEAARASLDAVLAQVSDRDRIFMVVCADASPSVALDARVQLVQRDAGLHPNAVLATIADDVAASHLLVLNAGVTLAPEALTWFGVAIARIGSVIIYSDEDRISRRMPAADIMEPVFRPAFDRDLLLQRNYIGETFCVSCQAFRELGGFACDLSIDPRYDFLLRAYARYGPNAFSHLPLVLVHDHTFRPVMDEAVQERRIRTVQEHLETTGTAARAVAHDDTIGRALRDAVKVVWSEDRPRLISLIVPTRDNAEMVSALVASLLDRTADWHRVELVVLVNGHPDEKSRDTFAGIQKTLEHVKIVYREMSFNWGAICNTAAAEFSDGDLLVFLNDDILCVSPDWDIRLRSQLARSEVSVLGGRLLYPNGTIQHAGIVFADAAQNLHEGAGNPVGDGLYLDRTLLAHQTAATTGAFLACRRDIFEQLNGFDTRRFTVTCSDVDFCVRARGNGGIVLYDPFLTWIHYESVSRGFDDDSESSRLRFDEEFTRWRAHCTAFDLVDLNLNPHFVRSPRPFEVFHRVDGQTVDTWLMAQRHRREQAAVKRVRRSVEGVPGLAYSQGADLLS